MTLVCSGVIKVAGIEASPMATLLVFIIGLLPLSCHHSEHCSSRGIVFWDSTQLGWLQLQSSALLHAGTPRHVACNALTPLAAAEEKNKKTNYNHLIRQCKKSEIHSEVFDASFVSHDSLMMQLEAVF